MCIKCLFGMNGNLLKEYCNVLITARKCHCVFLPEAVEPKEPEIVPSPHYHQKLNKEGFKRNNSVLS